MCGATSHQEVYLYSELAQLRDQIRDNERIWSGFRQIEVKMISAQSLREVVATLCDDLPRLFSGVDCVTLACDDPRYDLSRLVYQNDIPEVSAGSFISMTSASLNTVFPEIRKPKLGPCDAALRSLLFPRCARPVVSVAVAPLVLRHELVGALNQGSGDPNHFSEDAATDLLEHLAAVTAICVENTVNRERLKQDGLTDPLTGVANRRFFERRLKEEVERWSRRGEPLACMLIDVDHFKQVNDRHGHQAGDRVLQGVAQVLGRDLRAVDVLARYGGEEFVLLLPATNARQGAAIAERLRACIAHQVLDGPARQPLYVTVSIGVACLREGRALSGEAAGSWLLRQADGALYAAKQAGRDHVVIDDSS